MNIPEGCKAVTVKVDGCKVTTEFEPEWNPQDGDFLTDMQAQLIMEVSSLMPSHLEFYRKNLMLKEVVDLD